MTKRISLLLTIGLVLSLGGVAFAKETTKSSLPSYSIEQSYELPATATVESVGSEVSDLANFVISKTVISTNHFIVNMQSLEVRDPVFYSPAIVRQSVPTPATKRLRAQKLIRLILKHPSNI